MNDLPTRETMLERAAYRASRDEWMLASALRSWCGEGDTLDIDAVAAALGCARSAVVSLALCRRPMPTAPTFRVDVGTIAASVGVDEFRLLGLLRECDALSAFRTGSGKQVLAAARDERDPDRSGTPDRGEHK